MMKDRSEISILLIEDNPGDMLLVEDYLSENFSNYHLNIANTYKMAREFLDNREQDLHVILVDLTLPDIDRDKMAEEILTYKERCPILILTGFEDLEFAKQTLSTGISDYLLKDYINADILYRSIVYNIERRKFVLKIQNSEKRYNDLFHFSPIPIFLYNFETNRILEANESALKQFGYNREDFDHLEMQNLFITDSYNHLCHNFFQSDLKSNLHANKLELVKKNGDLISVEVYTKTLVLNGQVCKMILTNDITEKQNHISMIENQNKKLKEIAWTQSHVVRAPLSRIMGLTQLIQNNLINDHGELLKITDHIMASSRELDSIVQDLILKSQIINETKEGT